MVPTAPWRWYLLGFMGASKQILLFPLFVTPALYCTDSYDNRLILDYGKKPNKSISQNIQLLL